MDGWLIDSTCSASEKGLKDSILAYVCSFVCFCFFLCDNNLNITAPQQHKTTPPPPKLQQQQQEYNEID